MPTCIMKHSVAALLLSWQPATHKMQTKPFMETDESQRLSLQSRISEGIVSVCVCVGGDKKNFEAMVSDWPSYITFLWGHLQSSTIAEFRGIFVFLFMFFPTTTTTTTTTMTTAAATTTAAYPTSWYAPTSCTVSWLPVISTIYNVTVS